MKDNDTSLIVMIILLALMLFGGFGMMGFGGFGYKGIMNYGCGMVGGYNYGFSSLIGVIISVLFIVILILGILWLVKQLQKDNRRRR